MQNRVRVGVDVGGTFTDICLVDERGSVVVEKIPSTPSDPSRGIIDGLQRVLVRAGASIADVTYFGHGTTVATNALLEQRSPSPGLVTGAGFRDLLEIGRQTRPHLYDLQADKVRPLVPRNLRREVPERVLANGTVLEPLDRDAMRRVVRELIGLAIPSLAICFLHSYINPEHELLARDIALQEDPSLLVTLSHEVVPEFREFERISTTVINAYLMPCIKDYVQRLRDGLLEIGYAGPAYITRSNGGVSSLEDVTLRPVSVVLSGPSTGVVGATHVAQQAGIASIMTIDMGGTSTDVSLVANGQVSIGIGRDVNGYLLQGPVVDIGTIGAGGGSVAWVDQGHVLKVGPISVGANPGPACYDKGGQSPTLTDAHVVLGTLNPNYLLGGGVPLNAEASHRVVSELARELGTGKLAAARGIVSVILSNSVRAARTISVRRGFDPRDFTLVAFGGGGPLHAALLAREMSIPRVLIHRSPGILCAYGLLVTDLRHDFARTHILSADDSSAPMAAAILANLDGRAETWLNEQGIARRYGMKRWFVDMRYKGQNYELRVPVPRGHLSAQTMNQLIQQFYAIHEARYGHSAAGEPIQLVTFRVEAVGTMRRAFNGVGALDGQQVPSIASAQRGTRVVHLLEESSEWPVYDRDSLRPGHSLTGPAIVEQFDTTSLILPDQYVEVDEFENLVLRELGSQHAWSNAETSSLDEPATRG